MSTPHIIHDQVIYDHRVSLEQIESDVIAVHGSAFASPPDTRITSIAPVQMVNRQPGLLVEYELEGAAVEGVDQEHAVLTQLTAIRGELEQRLNDLVGNVDALAVDLVDIRRRLTRVEEEV